MVNLKRVGWVMVLLVAAASAQVLVNRSGMPDKITEAMSSGEPQVTNQQLRDLAEGLREAMSLPLEVAEGQILEDIHAEGRAVSYRYTLTNAERGLSDAEQAEREAEMADEVRMNLCADYAARQESGERSVFDIGVPFQYWYEDADRRLIAAFHVSVDDCR